MRERDVCVYHVVLICAQLPKVGKRRAYTMLAHEIHIEKFIFNKGGSERSATNFK